MTDFARAESSFKVLDDWPRATSCISDGEIRKKRIRTTRPAQIDFNKLLCNMFCVRNMVKGLILACVHGVADRRT